MCTGYLCATVLLSVLTVLGEVLLSGCTVHFCVFVLLFGLPVLGGVLVAAPGLLCLVLLLLGWVVVVVLLVVSGLLCLVFFLFGWVGVTAAGESCLLLSGLCCVLTLFCVWWALLRKLGALYLLCDCLVLSAPCLSSCVALMLFVSPCSVSLCCVECLIVWACCFVFALLSVSGCLVGVGHCLGFAVFQLVVCCSGYCVVGGLPGVHLWFWHACLLLWLLSGVARCTVGCCGCCLGVLLLLLLLLSACRMFLCLVMRCCCGVLCVGSGPVLLLVLVCGTPVTGGVPGSRCFTWCCSLCLCAGLFVLVLVLSFWVFWASCTVWVLLLCAILSLGWGDLCWSVAGSTLVGVWYRYGVCSACFVLRVLCLMSGGVSSYLSTVVFCLLCFCCGVVWVDSTPMCVFGELVVPLGGCCSVVPVSLLSLLGCSGGSAILGIW